MIASFLYLLLGALLGFTLLRASKTSLNLIEQIIWGIPLGIMLLAAWSFAWAYAIKVQDWAILGSCATVAAVIFYYFNLDAHRIALHKEWRALRTNITRRDILAWALVLIPWTTFTILTVPRLLHFENGALIAGWINLWGDWAVHLRNSTFLAAQDKLSLENPLFSGTDFHYPYLSSYLSAILQRFGLSIDRSLTWPTIALFGTLPAVLYILGQRLTKSRKAGVFFSYIVLLAGGLGIVYLFQDLMHGKYFWEASAYAPRLYTDYRYEGSYFNEGIWFMNFIMSEFLPQRAFLAGLPIALYVLYIAWTHLIDLESTKTIIKEPLIFAGVLFGLLPLIHTHSFIALGIIIPVITIFSAARSVMQHKAERRSSTLKHLWYAIYLIGPATLLGFALLFFFVFDPNGTGKFIHLITWWMPSQEEARDNPVAYWLRNAGPIIVLGFIASFWKGKAFRPLLFAGAILWLLANFISFQPWHYDNLKILTYWYILWALPVAVLLAALTKQLKIIALIAFVALVGAGLADTLSVAVSAQSGLQLSSPADVAFATQVKQVAATTPGALFIAATNHDNPISALSGQRMYLGYEGWLWTYGIDSNTRNGEIQEMYMATEAGLQLIKDRGIQYIAIGPQERAKYKVNDAVLTGLYPAVVNMGEYKLLKVF